MRSTYTYEYTRGKKYFDEKTKTAPLPGRRREHGRGRPGRVGRDEHGEARRANITPNGGPHFELERLWLKSGLNLTSRLLRRHVQHIYTNTNRDTRGASLRRPDARLGSARACNYRGSTTIIGKSRP